MEEYVQNEDLLQKLSDLTTDPTGLDLIVLFGSEDKDALQTLKKDFDISSNNKKKVVIPCESYFDYEYVNNLREVFKGCISRLTINVTKTQRHEGCVFDERETEKLNNLFNVLKAEGITSYICDTEAAEEYPIDEVIRANLKIDHWAEQINSATVDGRPLSPLEKFLYAYNIVKDFNYVAEGEKESQAVSRHIVNVLNGEKIVCVGFANILVALCKKIGIPCVNRNIKNPNHACCDVFIKDDIYEIEDIFYSEPTVRDNHFALIRHSDVKDMYKTFGLYKDVDVDQMTFDVTNYPYAVDDDTLAFFDQLSESVREKNKEYIKYYSDTKNKYFNSAEYVKFTDEIVDVWKLSKEERIQVIQKYFKILSLKLDTINVEVMYQKIEEMLEPDISLFPDMAKINLLMIGDSSDYVEDKKANTIQAKAISLDTIEQALVNVYRSGRRTESQAERFAHERMRSEYAITDYDQLCKILGTKKSETLEHLYTMRFLYGRKYRILDENFRRTLDVTNYKFGEKLDNREFSTEEIARRLIERYRAGLKNSNTVKEDVNKLDDWGDGGFSV